MKGSKCCEIHHTDFVEEKERKRAYNKAKYKEMGLAAVGAQRKRIEALEAKRNQKQAISPSLLKGGKPYEPGVLPLKPPGGRP